MPPDTPQPETDVSVYDEPLHRVEYEHPLFRVIRLRIAPGAQTQFHRRDVDSFFCLFSTTRVRVETARDGVRESAVERMTVEATPYSREPIVRRIKNIGEADVHGLDVEVVAHAEPRCMLCNAFVTGVPFLREVPCFEQVDDLLPWCCTTPRRVKLPGGGYATDRVTHTRARLQVMTFLCANSIVFHNWLEMKPGLCCACCDDSCVPKDTYKCTAGGCERMCAFDNKNCKELRSTPIAAGHAAAPPLLGFTMLRRSRTVGHDAARDSAAHAALLMASRKRKKGRKKETSPMASSPKRDASAPQDHDEKRRREASAGLGLAADCLSRLHSGYSVTRRPLAFRSTVLRSAVFWIGKLIFVEVNHCQWSACMRSP